MKRRALAASGVASVALVAGGLVWVAADGSRAGGSGAEGDGADAASGATAEVTRRDLEERVEVDGTLGYGDTSDVTLAGGTITDLPDVGTVVGRGQSLAEVDGSAVPLLLGERPLWRQLGPGVDDGPDVAQLEFNLVALGIVTTDELTVDEEWTSATTAAVKEWQESIGRPETGTVAPGQAVFLPTEVRVVDHPAPIGAQAGGPVLTVSGTGRLVSVDLDADSTSLVEVGEAVEVGLPDGTTIPGKVASVGAVATAPADDETAPGEESGATVDVTVTLDDPSQGAAFDEAPVSVSLVTSSATDVLAVPVDALLALAEGGYAVERVTEGAGGSASELVAVELGAFADGWVEVTGDIAEGDEVEVPE
jgi:hypothetical protein